MKQRIISFVLTLTLIVTCCYITPLKKAVVRASKVITFESEGMPLRYAEFENEWLYYTVGEKKHTYRFPNSINQVGFDEKGILWVETSNYDIHYIFYEEGLEELCAYSYMSNDDFISITLCLDNNFVIGYTVQSTNLTRNETFEYDTIINSDYHVGSDVFEYSNTNTPSPTQEPAVQTEAPTQKPTVDPTTKPTIEPTTKPTIAPTTKPSPSPNVTIAPSKSPDKISKVSVSGNKFSLKDTANNTMDSFTYKKKSSILTYKKIKVSKVKSVSFTEKGKVIYLRKDNKLYYFQGSKKKLIKSKVSKLNLNSKKIAISYTLKKNKKKIKLKI